MHIGQHCTHTIIIIRIQTKWELYYADLLFSQRKKHTFTKLCSESANLRQGVWPQSKVIRDSKPDFRSWIRMSVVDLLAYFVSVSHFAECCQNRPVTVWEMLINVNPKILSFAHRLISFAVILHTDRHSERQTERMTDKSTWSHKLRLDGDDKVYRYYLRQGGYVIGDVCLSVCLSVCEQDYWKSNAPISLKLGVMILHINRNDLLTFVGDLLSDVDSGSVFHFPHYCGIANFRRFISISHTVTSRLLR